MKIFFAIYIIISLFFFNGCNSEKLYVNPPIKSNNSVTQRANLFAKSVAEIPSASVLISPQELDYYLDFPNDFCDKISELKFSMVGFPITSLDLIDMKEQKAKKFAALINVLDFQGIKAMFYLKEGNFIYKLPRNPMLRRFSELTPFFNHFGNLFKEFSNLLNNQSEMPIITIELEMQKFTMDNSDKPDSMLYVWSDDNYGKNGENSMLFQQSLTNIKELRKILKLEQLIIAVNIEVLQKGINNKLDNAKISDLLKICDNVIIICQQETGSEVVKQTQKLINSSSTIRSVFLQMEIARNFNRRNNQLRRTTWSDFCKDTADIIKAYKDNQAFEGIIFTPFESIENLLWRF